MTKPILNFKRNAHGQFVVGTDRPNGRPKGSKNKLGERFLRDLYDFWREEGSEVIKRAAYQSPSSFMRTMAIYLRPTMRDQLEEMPDEFEHAQTPEELVDAVRDKLGDDSAKRLAQIFMPKTKRIARKE